LPWLVFHLSNRLPFVVDADRALSLFSERERLIVLLRNFSLVAGGPEQATPELRGWLSQLLNDFERRWPQQDSSTRSYPAFEHRTQA
jgi:hypothetical protein